MPDQLNANIVGFDPEEIRTNEPTRSARLKWVVIVDSELPPGRATNAAICVSAATATSVPGLLGPPAVDTSGNHHPGLPWAGCTVVEATPEQLIDIRQKGLDSIGVFVADMPTQAQHTRVYDEYLAEVGTTAAEDAKYYAVSLVGPRNRIDKIVKKLSLLP